MYYYKEDNTLLSIADLFDICDDKDNFDSWLYDNIYRYDLLVPVEDQD